MDADDFPPDARAAARRRLRGVDGDPDAERVREARARYYAEHRDRHLALSRRWKQLNPERARELNRDSMRRARLARRKVEARRERGRAWYREHRDQERERARRFRAEHPDKIHQYQQRFRERHPDRVTEQSRRASMRWRDKDAEAVRARQREEAARRREADPNIHRRYYHENLEQQRARSRDGARRRRRLQQLGLPPRRIHRVFANEKRVNEAAADTFFSQRRTAQQKRDLLLERDAPPHARLARADGRRRARAGEPPSEPIDLASATAIDMERQIWMRVLPDIVTDFLRRNRNRIQEEVRMDSIARQQMGKPPYDLTVELARRLRVEVFMDALKRLVPDGDSERRRRLAETMFPRRAPSPMQVLDPNGWRELAPAATGPARGLAR
ncbi:hypothetical protein [Microbacterium aurum]